MLLFVFGTNSVDPALRAHCMKEALTEVILTYFRVLKSSTDAAAQGTQGGGQWRSQLPAALEGLASFAHLVNVDTIEDLLGELKLLLTSAEATASLPLDAVLNCVRTAMVSLFFFFLACRGAF